MTKKSHLFLRLESPAVAILLIVLMASCATGRVSRSDKMDRVVDRARSYIGVPYKYGGSTSVGMDCSGLLMRSFEAVDVHIPRTAKQQSKMGKPVSLWDVQKGDLVFFSFKKGKRKVTHAGLVTEARGNRTLFIHASSSRGVIESDLSSDYYKQIFVKARRLKL
jgi:cell wall-associated NlpC family hydrolase